MFLLKKIKEERMRKKKEKIINSLTEESFIKLIKNVDKELVLKEAKIILAEEYENTMIKIIQRISKDKEYNFLETIYNEILLIKENNILYDSFFIDKGDGSLFVSNSSFSSIRSISYKNSLGMDMFFRKDTPFSSPYPINIYLSCRVSKKFIQKFKEKAFAYILLECFYIKFSNFAYKEYLYSVNEFLKEKDL